MCLFGQPCGQLEVVSLKPVLVTVIKVKIWIQQDIWIISTAILYICQLLSSACSGESSSLCSTYLHQVLATPARWVGSPGAAAGKDKPKSYRVWCENWFHTSQMRSYMLQSHLFLWWNKIFAVWHQWLPLHELRGLSEGGEELSSDKCTGRGPVPQRETFLWCDGAWYGGITSQSSEWYLLTTTFSLRGLEETHSIAAT